MDPRVQVPRLSHSHINSACFVKSLKHNFATGTNQFAKSKLSRPIICLFRHRQEPTSKAAAATWNSFHLSFRISVCSLISLLRMICSASSPPKPCSSHKEINCSSILTHLKPSQFQHQGKKRSKLVQEQAEEHDKLCQEVTKLARAVSQSPPLMPLPAGTTISQAWEMDSAELWCQYSLR